MSVHVITTILNWKFLFLHCMPSAHIFVVGCFGHCLALDRLHCDVSVAAYRNCKDALEYN